ncbi:hypothetical protein LJC55_04315 [Eubacteriales bacterium OttesenSCG-928-N14]|nr:hypothetical protein [Eubacteriales bacterium OttesenSCG-928-N14]
MRTKAYLILLCCLLLAVCGCKGDAGQTPQPSDTGGEDAATITIKRVELTEQGLHNARLLASKESSNENWQRIAKIVDIDGALYCIGPDGNRIYVAPPGEEFTPLLLPPGGLSSYPYDGLIAFEGCLYVSIGGSKGLWQIDLTDNNKLTQLYYGNATLRFAYGEMLVFTSYDTDTGRMLLSAINMDGNGVYDIATLSAEPQEEGQPLPTGSVLGVQDGKLLYSTPTEQGTFQLWLHDMDTGLDERVRVMDAEETLNGYEQSHLNLQYGYALVGGNGDMEVSALDETGKPYLICHTIRNHMDVLPRYAEDGSIDGFTLYLSDQIYNNYEVITFTLHSVDADS